MTNTQTIDLPALIDSKPLSKQQYLIIGLCSLVALLDGLDTQSIGVAAPLIAKLFGMERAQLAPIFSAGLLGAAIGALTFGPLADHFGRRLFLALATATFGAFTFLTAFCADFNTLLACRFAAGLGLGGALPCFVAISSEFSPSRLRAAVVSIAWAAFPVGGFIGGFLNGAIIGQFGWQAIFYIGGVLPMLVAVLLIMKLPNSLRQEYPTPAGQARLAALVERMFGEPLATGTHFYTREVERAGLPVRHLFTEGRALGTLLLWVPFFMGFGTLTVVVLWTPALLGIYGIPPAATAQVVAWNGFGAAIGMAMAGTLMQRLGIMKTLVPAFLLGALATIGLGRYAGSIPLASLFTGLVGLFIAFGMAGAVALASLVYPDPIRGTGTGWAMGLGRIGQTLSPLLAGALLARQWPVPDILLVIAIAPAIAAVFVILLRLEAGRDPAIPQ